MKPPRILACAALALVTTPAWQAADAASEARKDVQLRAMLDELARAKTLSLSDLDKPYFIEFDCGDSQDLTIVTSLGGLISSRLSTARVPRLQVRVGDYKFDNTNSIFSSFFRSGGAMPYDDYGALRTAYWLASDATYKAAAEQMTRKRNALREIADPGKTPDFAPAPAVQLLRSPTPPTFEQARWENILRAVSAQFVPYPDIRNSSVRLRFISSTYRLVNSEGSIIRVPQDLNSIFIRAQAQAADGRFVWNHVSFTPAQPSGAPDEKQLLAAAAAMAKETDELAKAPIAGDYSGPVLFEQLAAAQMMASVMNDAARLHRKPLAPPGANTPQFLESVWASKLNAKVLPEWMSLIDDPLVKESQGVPLVGSYEVDDEGVKAQKVTLVDKGTLKGFLTSRQPVRDSDTSNGHGRLPGGFGAQAGVIGNLFVEVSAATPEAQMKTKLIEKAKASGANFGLLIRRLDFPFTGDTEELQSLGRQLQKNGYARTVNSPVLAYRVYLDGHEELVRGLRFKEFSAKDLRDVDAASDHPYVLNYMNNGTAFNFADFGADLTTSSVICPSLLFDSLELARAESEPGKQPLVSAPLMSAAQ